MELEGVALRLGADSKEMGGAWVCGRVLRERRSLWLMKGGSNRGGARGSAGREAWPAVGGKGRNPRLGGIAVPLPRTMDFFHQSFRLCYRGYIHSKHADSLGCPRPLRLRHLREDPAGVGRGKAPPHMAPSPF